MVLFGANGGSRLFGANSASRLFGANGGCQAIYEWPESTIGLAMAGHPWILPLLTCIKAISLIQLN